MILWYLHIFLIYKNFTWPKLTICCPIGNISNMYFAQTVLDLLHFIKDYLNILKEVLTTVLFFN